MLYLTLLSLQTLRITSLPETAAMIVPNPFTHCPAIESHQSGERVDRHANHLILEVFGHDKNDSAFPVMGIP